MRAGVVSTIIPVFNRAALLTEAVDSVLAQTYPLNEIVIVDDGSTDDTGAVAQAFVSRHPGVVKYARLSRGREWRARNHGLTLATGEFIQFLDSDDLIVPEKLATQVRALRAHPECGISYCYVREYAMGDPLPRVPARRTGETFETLFPALLSGRIWPYPSPLFRRGVIDAAGGFLELSAYPDWELECRMAVNGVRLHHCRSFLAETRNTHAIEGRRKSVKPPDTLRDVALIFSVILDHARRANVPAEAIDRLSPRLFNIGRQCASIGLVDEARRSIGLARGAAIGPRRLAIGAYARLSQALGWELTGRCAERAVDATRRVARPVRRSAALWRHRAAVAFDEVSGRPLLAWPHSLATLWLERPSRQQRR
jgi:hypothetical protein